MLISSAPPPAIPRVNNSGAPRYAERHLRPLQAQALAGIDNDCLQNESIKSEGPMRLRCVPIGGLTAAAAAAATRASSLCTPSPTANTPSDIRHGYYGTDGAPRWNGLSGARPAHLPVSGWLLSRFPR